MTWLQGLRGLGDMFVKRKEQDPRGFRVKRGVKLPDGLALFGFLHRCRQAVEPLAKIADLVRFHLCQPKDTGALGDRRMEMLFPHVVRGNRLIDLLAVSHDLVLPFYGQLIVRTGIRMKPANRRRVNGACFTLSSVTLKEQVFHADNGQRMPSAKRLRVNECGAHHSFIR